MNFISPRGTVSRKQENEKLLKDILFANNILKIKKSTHPNANSIIQICKLNYGFTMTENGSEKADKDAIEFPQDVTLDIHMNELGYTKCENEGTCKHTQENFLLKTLMIGGKASLTIPSSLSFGISLSHEHQIKSTYHTECFYGYKIILLPRCEIEVKIEKIKPTETFKQAVDDALKKTNPMNELKIIRERFGEYIAKKVKIGGRIDRIVYHNASNSSQENPKTRSIGGNIGSELVKIKSSYKHNNGHSEFFSISSGNFDINVYGGDIKTFDKDNMALWKDSLNDYTTWSVIQYVNLVPIFDILDPEIHQKILEIMGRKILYSKIDIIDGVNMLPLSESPYVHKLKIPDPKLDLKECQIFATVMSKEQREVFSTRIIICASLKDNTFPNNYSVLAKCTQEILQEGSIHPTLSQLLVGVHFCCVGSQLEACFFIYDLKKEREKLYRAKFSITSFAQGDYLTLKRASNWKISDNSILYKAPVPWTYDMPTFISLFYKTCPCCIVGFTNLIPEHLIFNSLVDDKVDDDPRILYFCAPPSIQHT
ncbi:hsp70 family protein [Gigaspora margarita]|uniref:Hsp70 family protein n=1 Tax=Gigaspora margarita TaxID=4874 RepID=A0A8H4EV74_GIGMA|nr:hsp70 family protein [Gigaspora margarita]